MIKEFKIHSNYLIEGANVKVSWKTKGVVFVKFHIDSWSKGWLRNNDVIQLNLNRNINKITLYAVGFDKIHKKEIKIKLDKLKENKIRGKKIIKNQFKSKRYLIKTFSDFSLIKTVNGLKSNNIQLLEKEIKPKINYNKLKLKKHE